jgi:hypothetical protein
MGELAGLPARSEPFNRREPPELSLVGLTSRPGLLSHENFPHEAHDLLSSVKPFFDQTWVLDPKSPVYRDFLSFVRQSLDTLPSSREHGEPVEMRADARQAISRLSSFLRIQEGRIECGEGWRPGTQEIADIFKGWLEVYKYEIYPRHERDGTGLNLDLFVMAQSGEVGLRLQRFNVRQGPPFDVERDSEICVYLGNGSLKLDLSPWPVNVHLGQ